MTCSSSGAGGLTTVENYRPPRGKKGVGEKKKGMEVTYNLKGNQRRGRHMKR